MRADSSFNKAWWWMGLCRQGGEGVCLYCYFSKSGVVNTASCRTVR